MPIKRKDLMEIIHACYCGLDVHARTVVACLIKHGRKQTRTFSTMTDDLLRLSDWLVAEGCTHAAIESTGCTEAGLQHFEACVGGALNAYHAKPCRAGRCCQRCDYC